MSIEVIIETQKFEEVLKKLSEIIMANDLKVEINSTKVTIDLATLIKPEVIVNRIRN